MSENDRMDVDEDENVMTDADFERALEALQEQAEEGDNIGELLKVLNESQMISWDEAERILGEASNEPIKSSLPPQTRPSEPDNDTDVDQCIRRLLDDDPTLVEINLNNMKRTPVPQIKRIIEALRNNTHLEKLSLANMGLYDSDVAPLIEVVESNEVLRCINLETNYLSGEFFQKLFKAALTHQSVEEVKAVNQGVSFSTESERGIITAISGNRGLTKISINLRLPEGRHKVEQASIRNQEIRRVLRRQAAAKAKAEEEERRLAAEVPKLPPEPEPKKVARKPLGGPVKPTEPPKPTKPPPAKVEEKETVPLSKQWQKGTPSRASFEAEAMPKPEKPIPAWKAAIEARKAAASKPEKAEATEAATTTTKKEEPNTESNAAKTKKKTTTKSSEDELKSEVDEEKPKEQKPTKKSTKTKKESATDVPTETKKESAVAEKPKKSEPTSTPTTTTTTTDNAGIPAWKLALAERKKAASGKTSESEAPKEFTNNGTDKAEVQPKQKLKEKSSTEATKSSEEEPKAEGEDAQKKTKTKRVKKSSAATTESDASGAESTTEKPKRVPPMPPPKALPKPRRTSTTSDSTRNNDEPMGVYPRKKLPSANKS